MARQRRRNHTALRQTVGGLQRSGCRIVRRRSWPGAAGGGRDGEWITVTLDYSPQRVNAVIESSVAKEINISWEESLRSVFLGGLDSELRTAAYCSRDTTDAA